MKNGKERYLISTERQQIEAIEIALQEQPNERSFLPWNRILETVNPEKRYRIVFHGEPQVHQGCRLLEFLFDRLTGQGCTFTESVTEVPNEYELPFEEMWHTESDSSTGRTMVLGHELDYLPGGTQ